MCVCRYFRRLPKFIYLTSGRMGRKAANPTPRIRPSVRPFVRSSVRDLLRVRGRFVEELLAAFSVYIRFLVGSAAVVYVVGRPGEAHGGGGGGFLGTSTTKFVSCCPFF